MNTKIIIGGGVGPMAGVKLQEYVIQNTDNGGVDQGHLDVIHMCMPSKISDRTKYLLNQAQTNPGQQMAEIINPIIDAYQSDKLLIGVPCNTFHAPPIFDSFIENLNPHPDLVVINMIDATIEFIQQSLPTLEKIGLMSTTGTRELNIYTDKINNLGIELVQVSKETQVELHDTIYNPDFGIKSHSAPVTKIARERFLSYSQYLISHSANAIILGCTEIPLALPETNIGNVVLVDPMQALAKKLVGLTQKKS